MEGLLWLLAISLGRFGGRWRGLWSLRACAGPCGASAGCNAGGAHNTMVRCSREGGLQLVGVLVLGGWVGVRCTGRMMDLKAPPGAGGGTTVEASVRRFALLGVRVHKLCNDDALSNGAAVCAALCRRCVGSLWRVCPAVLWSWCEKAGRGVMMFGVGRGNAHSGAGQSMRL